MKRIKILLFALFIPMLLISQYTDIEILRKINLSRNRQFDTFFIAVTHTAGPIAFGFPVLLLGFALYKKNKPLKRKSLYLSASVVTAVVITNILKYTINRPRPFETYSFIEKVTSGGSPSFPSGHTSDAFVIATAISLAWPKRFIVIPSYLWAMTIAYSRMGLGVHYPIDVLAGTLIGIASSVVLYYTMLNYIKS